jgi:hypothetical protein
MLSVQPISPSFPAGPVFSQIPRLEPHDEVTVADMSPAEPTLVVGVVVIACPSISTLSDGRLELALD